MKRGAGALRAFGIMKRRLWGRREVSLKVKMKIFKAMVVPALTYAASTWAMTRTYKKRTYALEIKILRAIMGIRWTNRITNGDTRKRLQQVLLSLRVRQARLK